MQTNKSNFLDAIKDITAKIKKDGNWTYSQSTSGYSFTDARSGKRTGNCAHFVCWALRSAGLLPEKGWFYIKGGTINYQGSGSERTLIAEYIDKYFEIIYVNKPIKDAGLKHGDIVGFKSIAHTCVFDKYDDTTKMFVFWDGGTAANKDGKKYDCHVSVRSYGHNVALILRPKTFYYKKPTIKTNSLVDALSNIGVKNSFEKRKKIAGINGITNYRGTADQNENLLKKLKAGKLVRK